MMKRKLIPILKERLGLDEAQLADIASSGAAEGRHFGELLLKKRIVSEPQLLQALGQRYRIPFCPALPLDCVATDMVRSIPIQFLKTHRMVPLKIDPGRAPEESAESASALSSPDHPAASGWVVAINDPTALQAVDDLAKLMGLSDYRLLLAPHDAIFSAINMAYDFTSGDSAEQLVQTMEENGSTIISEIEETADLLDDTSEAPIIKLVNHTITQAIKARASDIHFEPYQDSFKIRYRIDGILYDRLSPPKWIQPALISRIKVMAKLNIAEKRLPQDGRLSIKIGDQDIDIRVSTVPTAFGERLVLRLLNKTSSLMRLSDLGMSVEQLEMLDHLIRTPNGILLVTGPTGSGKTTSLYAALSTINSPNINIITIEDPIEYQINGISQIQVNPKINLTFASGLRSIVRQDPDVILVGEIRDVETAEIAVQSALTGHLVFSTLHTNDSASAITRLVDIGVEPFLISSSVIAVIAQRLVRVLCNDCKEPYTPEEMLLRRIGIDPQHEDHRPFFKAVGCERCFHTGFRGRIGIFEIMLMDSHLKSLVLRTFDAGQIKNEAIRRDMVSLHRDGMQKVYDGTTTLEEILRVTQQ